MRYVLLMLAALVLSACGGVTTTTEITTRYTPPTGFMSDRQLYQRQPAQIDLERRDVAKGHMSNVATACIFDRYNAYGICREQDWGGGLVYVCYDRRWLDVQPFGLPLHASKQVQGYRGLTAPVYVVGPVGSYSWRPITTKGAFNRRSRKKDVRRITTTGRNPSPKGPRACMRAFFCGFATMQSL